MCVWKQFVIFICITLSAWAQQQNGGSLHCPVEWFNGSTIRLKFLINETLFPSVCTSGTDYSPYFQRKTSASDTFSSNCTVPDIRTSCGSFDPDDLGCGCVGKNGSYILQYNFIAHGDYDGFWGADILCPDASANPLLTFSANSCDNKRVKNDPCDGDLCKRGGVCSVNNAGGPTCNCSGTYHSGDQCTLDPCSGKPDCTVTTFPHQAHTINHNKETDVLIYIIFLTILGSVIFISWSILLWNAYRKFQTIEVCLPADVESQQKLTSEDTKKRIHDHIKKTFICCCCHGIDVIVCANSTCGLVTITLKYRVIWVFYLLDLQAKVEEFIYKDTLPGERPRPGDCVTPRQTPSEKSSCENTTRGPTPTRCLADCFTPRQTPSEKSSCKNTTRGSTPTRTGNPDVRVEPTPDYSVGEPMSQPKYTGKGNGVQR